MYNSGVLLGSPLFLEGGEKVTDWNGVWVWVTMGAGNCWEEVDIRFFYASCLTLTRNSIISPALS